MKSVIEKPFLWEGDIKDFIHPIKFMEDKTYRFDGWHGCSFLHKRINKVRGMSFEDSEILYSDPDYLEVRTFVSAWSNIYKYFIQSNDSTSMHICIERKIECEYGDFDKRMDALIDFPQYENGNVINAINIYVVEHKHMCVYPFEKYLDRLLEYHAAVKADPQTYVGSRNIVDKLRYIVHQPIMLIECEFCYHEAFCYYRNKYGVDFKHVNYTSDNMCCRCRFNTG